MATAPTEIHSNEFVFVFVFVFRNNFARVEAIKIVDQMAMESDWETAWECETEWASEWVVQRLGQLMLENGFLCGNQHWIVSDVLSGDMCGCSVDMAVAAMAPPASSQPPRLSWNFAWLWQF